MKYAVLEKFMKPSVPYLTVPTENMIHFKDYKQFKEIKLLLHNAITYLCDIITGQCSPFLKSKFKALNSWDYMEGNSKFRNLL